MDIDINDERLADWERELLATAPTTTPDALAHDALDKLNHEITVRLHFANSSAVYVRHVRLDTLKDAYNALMWAMDEISQLREDFAGAQGAVGSLSWELDEAHRTIVRQDQDLDSAYMRLGELEDEMSERSDLISEQQLSYALEV